MGENMVRLLNVQRSQGHGGDLRLVRVLDDGQAAATFDLGQAARAIADWRRSATPRPGRRRRRRRPIRTGNRWRAANNARGPPGSGTSCDPAPPTGDSRAWRNTACRLRSLSCRVASSTGIATRRANTSANWLRRSSGRCSTTMIGSTKPCAQRAENAQQRLDATGGSTDHDRLDPRQIRCTRS